MKYFLQTASVSENNKTRTHYIVTNAMGRVLMNTRHGDWFEESPDASGSPKMEISGEEYEALHKKLFPYFSCNMREEFEKIVSSFGTVICAEIFHYVGKNKIRLILGHTPEEYESFLDSLDFWYDCGHNSPNIGGIVWFQDETWATCEEYDGSEYWEHHKAPEIPEYLR